MPEIKPPSCPLNPWRARAQAYEEFRQLVAKVGSKDEKTHLWTLDWLTRQRDIASAQANKPMESEAEHLARKCVAAYRAAAAAWKRG